jgi:cell division protein FtsB
LQAAKAERQRRHRLWFDRWQKHALDCIPFSARRQVEPDVYRAVAEVLDACTPEQDETITRQLVEAAARGVVKRWERERHVERLVADARDWWLPLGARGCGGELSRWQVAAVKAAREAIAALPADTPLDVMEAAARQAVARVAEQFRDYQLREELVHSCAFLRRIGEPHRQVLENYLRHVLDQLPPGTPRALLEQARDKALKPIRDDVEKHWEAKRREQEEAKRRRQAESRAEWILSHLGHYLQFHKHFQYDGLLDLWDKTKELAKVLGPKLVEIILREPDINDEKLRRHVERLADEQLGLVAGSQRVQGERKRALR